MEIQKQNGFMVLTPTESDLNDPLGTSSAMERLLKEDGESHIVVDLKKIETLYSMQIGTLVTMHVLCYENVAVMRLSGANDRVKNLLRMVGLETLMEAHHGIDVAVQSFGPALKERRPAGPVDPRVKH